MMMMCEQTFMNIPWDCQAVATHWSLKQQSSEQDLSSDRDSTPEYECALDLLVLAASTSSSSSSVNESKASPPPPHQFTPPPPQTHQQDLKRKLSVANLVSDCDESESTTPVSTPLLVHATREVSVTSDMSDNSSTAVVVSNSKRSKQAPITSNFQCKCCNAVFMRNQDLTRHVSSVHERSVLFSCPACPGTRFSRKDALKRHIRTFKCCPTDTKLLPI